MLTQHLFKMKDISTLKKVFLFKTFSILNYGFTYQNFQLRTYLPVKNDVSDRVFGYELTIKLQDLHQV